LNSSNTENTVAAFEVSVGFVMVSVMQMHCWLCQWKNWENRSALDEVMKSNLDDLVFEPPFYGPAGIDQ